MGYSQSWFAIKGRTPASVLDELGLRGTGTREEIAESPLVSVELSGGWFLIITDKSGHRLIQDAVLKKLSVGCEIVLGDVEEHVMVSAATCWKNGVKIWFVVHDAQHDIEHLEAQGDLPPILDGIRDDARSKQDADGGREADVDHFFDVPVELAYQLIGYRHDAEIPGASDQPFEVLVQTSASSSTGGERPSVWKRLFGG